MVQQTVEEEEAKKDDVQKGQKEEVELEEMVPEKEEEKEVAEEMESEKEGNVYARAMQAGLSLEEVRNIYHLIYLFNHVVFFLSQARSFNGFFPLFVNSNDEDYPALPPNMTRLMEIKDGLAFQSMMEDIYDFFVKGTNLFFLDNVIY